MTIKNTYISSDTNAVFMDTPVTSSEGQLYRISFEDCFVKSIGANQYSRDRIIYHRNCYFYNGDSTNADIFTLETSGTNDIDLYFYNCIMYTIDTVGGETFEPNFNNVYVNLNTYSNVNIGDSGLVTDNLAGFTTTAGLIIPDFI